MKKIISNFKRLMPLCLMALAFTSCLKDKGYDDGLYGAVRGTEGGMYVSIRTSGLGNFAKSNISVDAASSLNDTVDLFIDLDYQFPTTKDVTVKIAFDDAKRIAYNTANSKNYQPITAGMVTLLSTSLTIPAGQRQAQTKVIIKQNLFDPSISYMFPVSITEAGATLSANLNTKYFNVIGNPIAGAYKWDYIRWNQSSPSPVPTFYPAGASSGWIGEPINFVPIDPTTVKVITGYYYQIDYNISFKNDNGVFSDFQVKFDKSQYDTYFAANGVNLVEGPKIVFMKPDRTAFEVHYTVFNGAAYRYIVDKFYK